MLKILRNFSRPEQRFITLGGEPNRGVITAELSHEALLEHWDTLRNWIAESREDLRFQRRLSEAAEEWHKGGRLRGLLWRSPALDLLRAFHQRGAADMTPVQIEFFEHSAQQQRSERQARYATVAVIFGVVLITALMFLRQNYLYWEETRPWARLVRLSTGQGYPLAHDTANVGRAAEGVKTVKHQVTLPERRISRIHLSISNAEIVSDWRSFYGTTVNSEWLRYGDERQLNNGDILVLSGLETFRYEPIRWRVWHYLATPEFANDPPAPGWALLVDGRRGTVRPIQSDEAFITVRAGNVEVTDQPIEGTILVVRRRLFEHDAPIVMQSIQTFKLHNEDRAVTSYAAGTLSSDRSRCYIKKNVAISTFQPLPAVGDRPLASYIKERDYDQRTIVLPANAESVFIVEGGHEVHGLGEAIFETEAGPFQIVPIGVGDFAQFLTCN